jgi:hypothetical protein
MRLDIEYRGSDAEKEYMKRIITPVEDNPYAYRNFYLDALVLGAKQVRHLRKRKSDFVVPVTLQFAKLFSNQLMTYKGNGTYSVSYNSDNIIKTYLEKGFMDEKIVFALTPKLAKGTPMLSYHGDLAKAKVFEADSLSIVFGYAIGDNYPKDIPFMIKMYYAPER